MELFSSVSILYLLWLIKNFKKKSNSWTIVGNIDWKQNILNMINLVWTLNIFVYGYV